MGSSPSIDQLQKKEEAFQQYLVSLKENAQKRVAELNTRLDENIKKFYAEGGWDDSKPFINGESYDVQHASDWSMKNVLEIVNAIGDAMLGRRKAPEGVDVKPPDSMGLAVDKLTELKLFAVNNAFDAVGSVLQSFTVSTQTQAKMDLRSSVVAPGLTLFLGVVEESYSKQDFFNGETILQYALVYKVYWSLKQAGDLSKFNDLLAYENQKQAYRKRLDELANKIADPNLDFDAVKRLQDQFDYYDKQLSALTKTIDELHTKKVVALRDTVASSAIKARK